MAYNDFEYSVQDSRPDELFDFEYTGDNSHHRITSSAYDIEFDGETYTASSVKGGKIQRSSEVGKNGLIMSVNRYDEYFSRYVSGSLTYDTTVIVYRLQDDASFIKAWTGTVNNVSRTDSVITITASPISSSSDKPILHRKDQLQCPHLLGDYYCGVNTASYSLTGTIDSIAGTTVVSTLFATLSDGYFNSGTLTVNGEKKTIISHIGDTVILLDVLYGAVSGLSFLAISGCDHSMATCDSKFSNSLNFGGCQWIPSADDIQLGKPFTY